MHFAYLIYMPVDYYLFCVSFQEMKTGYIQFRVHYFSRGGGSLNVVMTPSLKPYLYVVCVITLTSLLKIALRVLAVKYIVGNECCFYEK